MNFKDSKKIYLEKFSKHLPFVNILIFLTVLLVSYFALSPFYGFILSKEKEVQEKSGSLEESKASLDKLAKLKDEFPDLPSKVSVLDKITANQKDVEQFLAQVEKIAKKANLSITSFTPDLAPGKTEAGISLSGNKNDFKNFLEMLENNQLIIEITSLTFQETGTSMNFSVKIKVPWI